MKLYSKIKEQVNLNHMLDTAAQLASWERHAGTSTEREAFEYLKKRLDEYGYETTMIDCDNYIGLPVSCSFTVGKKEIHAQTHSLVPSACVEGPLVYCANVEEITYERCKGKIVLLPGRAVFEFVKPVQDAHGIGLICIQAEKIRECIPGACWGSPTNSDWERLPTIPVASVLAEDEDVSSLVETLKRNRGTDGKLTTVTELGWRKIPLLIGEIKAPVHTDRFVQFGGHLDSWYYGAIDNGTSNAVMLEVARLAKLHQNELKHNFRIVYYSGHSHGRYAGSAWYVDHMWDDLYKNCALNINTDCAGCKGAEELAYSIVMPEALPLAKEVIMDVTGAEFIGRRCARNGDQSYWNIGVTSAFASHARQKKTMQPSGKMGYAPGIAELGEFWHTPGDTLDCIDQNNLLRDGTIFAEYTLTCLTEPVIPLVFHKSAEDILGRIEDWQNFAGDAFDLSSCRDRAEKLYNLCKILEDTHMDSEVKNTTYLRIARSMTAANFIRRDIYGQEPAAAVDAMPALSELRVFMDESQSEKIRMAARLDAVRGRNFINHKLDEAIEVIERVL